MVRLHTVTVGSGSRRALVLHGLSSSAATLWPITDALAQAEGCTVVAPDLRGHGRSPAGERHSTRDYVGDLDDLGVWDLVVGHSLGGLIGLCAAQRPGWTERLVLLDPALEFSEAELRGHEQEGLEEQKALPTATELAAAHPRWHPRDAQYKAEAVQNLSPDTVSRTFRDIVPWRYAQLLHSLDQPTLVLGADPALGGVFPPALGNAAAEANPYVDFRVLAGTSHSLHRDAPEAVVAAIAEFARGA